MHARGYSLRRLIELTNPQSYWRLLDIATGGGHTALAFSGRVSLVVATDLTHRMLLAARNHAGHQASNIQFSQADAENLPFPSGAFDCVTCRIAPHHFPDVARFVQEAARVLKPGGVLGVADNITSGEPKIAQFGNILDKLRDPSHHWAYSLDDWETYLFAAGLRVIHSEIFEKETDFDEWASRVGVTGRELARLRVLLAQAPRDVRDWYSPRLVGTRLEFSIPEAIVIGAKLA